MPVWPSIALLLIAYASPQQTQTNCVAHRGFHVGQLENSMSAFVAATEIGVAGVEFDIQHTSDGIGIVQHDGTLERMAMSRPGQSCPLSAPISSISYADLARECVLKNGEPIPTLRQVIDYLSVQPVLSFIEAKDAFSEDSINLIYHAYESHPRRLVLLSFKPDLLRKIAASNLKDLIMQGSRLLHLASSFVKLNFDFSIAGIQKPNASEISKLREKAKAIDVWTIDSSDEIDFYLEQKVDYLTTNDPVQCLNKIVALGGHAD